MRKSMQIYSICLGGKFLHPVDPALRNSTTVCMLGYLRRTTTGTGYADSQRDDLTRFFSTETIIITGRHIKHDGFRFRTRFSLCVFLPTVATIFRRTGVTWAHFQCYLDDKYVGGFSTFCLHNGDYFFEKKKKNGKFA